MDISHVLLIWITGIEGAEDGSLKAFGSSVAGNHGFGDEADERYSGGVATISASEKRRLNDVYVSLAHVNKTGFYWRIEGCVLKDLPTVPFLLTSNLQLEVVASDKVLMHPAERWEQLQDVSAGPDYFWIKDRCWIGLLQFDARQSTEIGRLLQFSEELNPGLSSDARLLFAESESAVFGSLERLVSK